MAICITHEKDRIHVFIEYWRYHNGKHNLYDRQCYTITDIIKHIPDRINDTSDHTILND